MLQLFTALKITFSVKLKTPGLHLWQILYACGSVEAYQVLLRCCHNNSGIPYNASGKYTKLANDSYLESDRFMFTGYLRVVDILNPDNAKTNLKHCSGSSNDAVNTPPLGYEASNLKLYDVVFTLFLRTSQET
jgi:hypothetical protein